MSLSFMMSRSSPSILTSVPDHLPNRMRSPVSTDGVTSEPLSSRAPGPTATTSPSCGFSLAAAGRRAAARAGGGRGGGRGRRGRGRGGGRPAAGPAGGGAEGGGAGGRGKGRGAGGGHAGAH